MDNSMIPAIDQIMSVPEKPEFFCYFFPESIEVLIMCMTDICEDTDVRADDGFKFFHLIFLGNACFEDGQLVAGAHFPDRQRYADLRIVAFRAADDVDLLIHQLVKPFLDDGFSITASNADDRDLILGTVICAQCLESHQGIFDDDKVGLIRT